MQGNLKITTFLFLFLVAGFTSFSQDAVYSRKMLDKLESIRNHSHEHLKTAGKEESHRECITMLLREVKKNFSKLTPEAQDVFLPLATRPTLSGTQPSLSYSTAHFKIHYTKTGVDAVDLKDIGSNGIPDIVESMGQVFETVYSAEITSLGYYMPPSDGTAGGNSLYDIYIEDLGEGLYGYVSGDNFVGNNSNSPVKETDAATSYMGMNNDYSWVTGISPLDAIKVTAAHEFFHAIQYGITIDCSTFFAESTAAWMEDIVYPGIDDNLQYMSAIFSTPDVALDIQDTEDPNDDYNGHWYGGWTFWRYVTDIHGDDIIRKIWYRAITDYENDAYEAELAAEGSSFRGTFNDWLVANQLLTNNTAYSPYTYDRGNDYYNYLYGKYGRTVKKEKTLSFTGSDVTYSSTSGNSRLMRLSADYFTINPTGDFSVALYPSNSGVDFQLAMIKTNGTNGIEVVHGVPYNGGVALNVKNVSSYNSFILVVSRFDASAGIASEQYSFNLSNTILASTTDVASALQTNIYPNPASKELTVDYSINQPAVIEIADITGKKYFSSDLDVAAAGKLPVNVSGWVPGMYIVTIKDLDGKVGHQRLVITK